jgi:sirohydrochlorin ferrochelatase
MPSKSRSTQRSAVVLIAHGSRRREANDDAHWMAEELRLRDPERPVEVAFLELAQPNIEAAVASLMEMGAERVTLLPFFLSPGEHVRRDLEDWRRRLARQFPRATFELCEPLGRHPRLVDALWERLEGR